MKIFGLGGLRAANGNEDASETDLAPGNAPAVNGAKLGGDCRSDLLDQICRFLLNATLAITPRNLVIAHGIFSGSNHSLARKVFQQQVAGLPIDQKWLDDAFGESDEVRDTKAEFEKFTARFEKSLNSFSDNAQQASEAASDYTGALERTTQQLETTKFDPNDISTLIDLNRSMLERTRLLEESMQKSQAEAKKLRHSLKAARRDAEIDHLTGLANRRAFEAVYEREYREAQAAIDSLSVAFCDIDHFKRVNDTHGHDTGDRVIQTIAELFQSIAGEHYHVARHGGEEFVLLFRGLTAREAQERLDRAREAFAQRNLINKETNEPIGRVTFSGGVANVFAYADPRAALKAADEALYQAKESGRNQIALATA